MDKFHSFNYWGTYLEKERQTHLDVDAKDGIRYLYQVTIPE
jgi:hypothetical protein